MIQAWLMVRRALLAVALAGTAACALNPGQQPPPVQPAPAGDGPAAAAARPPGPVTQQMGIPAYFPPSSLWTQMADGAPAVGMVIVNPNSGPGFRQDPDWLDQIRSARRKQLTVVGYVDTSYAQRAAADVLAEIDLYAAWYGLGTNGLQGFFIDQVSNDCSLLGYYQGFYDHVKRQDSGALVILNPGTHIPECYVAAGDILMNFENEYSHYVDWQPTGWEWKYPPTRFWHLVHTTSQADLAAAVQLTRARNAGWVYVTPLGMPNPWKTLPPDRYWHEELALLRQPPPIYGWGTTQDQGLRYFRFSFSGEPGVFRVYVDIDRDRGSGFAIDGTGAEYKLENDRLYAYRAGAWAPVKGLAFTRSGHSVLWAVPRADLGDPARWPAALVFETQGANAVHRSGAVRPAAAGVALQNSNAPCTPGDQPIACPQVSHTATEVTFRYQYTGKWNWFRVYVDADNNAATGFPQAGHGAEYLLEGDHLYKYVGNGGWSWSPVKPVDFTQADGQLAWTAARADLGPGSTIGLLFQVDRAGLLKSLPSVTYTYK